MSVSATDLLADIKFFNWHIIGVRFINSDGIIVENKMPHVGIWNGGKVELDCRSSRLVQEALVKYGVLARAENPNNTCRLSFRCNGNDDVIALLCIVMNQQRTEAKLRHMEGVAQNVDQLIQMLPHVKSSLFIRNVKSMKRQIEVLRNIRQNER